MTDLQKRLFKMRDEKYKLFQAKLIPTVKPQTIIGVRTPAIRKLAKEFFKNGDWESFLNELPHEYFEENNIHAFVIECIKDFDEAIAYTEKFLPYIDNWATCDMFVPKTFKNNPDRLYAHICRWLDSERTYTVRYAVKMLMSLYLGGNFRNEYAYRVSCIKTEEYYVQTAAAWYFATALSKQYDAVIGYIADFRLDKSIHNMAIQKAVESRLINADTKEYLKSLKIK